MLVTHLGCALCVVKNLRGDKANLTRTLVTFLLAIFQLRTVLQQLPLVINNLLFLLLLVDHQFLMILEQALEDGMMMVVVLNGSTPETGIPMTQAVIRDQARPARLVPLAHLEVTPQAVRREGLLMAVSPQRAVPLIRAAPALPEVVEMILLL